MHVAFGWACSCYEIDKKFEHDFGENSSGDKEKKCKGHIKIPHKETDCEHGSAQWLTVVCLKLRYQGVC
jgi:hypothetical protein